MRFSDRRTVRAVVLFVLVALALISAGRGMRNAIDRSQDMQWSGVRMLMRHIDPWADALNKDPAHMILKSQIPNYLPLLYVLMLPLGAMPLSVAQVIWAVCNLAFAAVSALLAAHFYRLGRSMTLAVLCLIWMSTPARVTVGNGQYGLFVLVLWCASLLVCRMDDRRAMVAGVSYVKFNFAPPLFLYLLMKSGVRRALMSLVPVLVGAALVCVWLHEWHSAGEILRFFTAPMRVVETGGYFPRWGGTNLMDMVEPWLFRMHMPVAMLTPVSSSVALVTWGILFYKCLRRSADGTGWHIAILGLASFALFRHHSYDAVTLLFPLCFALSRWRSPESKLLLGIVGYFWYLQQVLSDLDPHYHWSNLRYHLEFLLLVAAMALTYRMWPGTQPNTNRELRSSAAAALH
jgi:hypothetical protein